MKYTHLFWDFNGTVLDDAYTSVLAVNEMLRARGLPETNLEIYNACAKIVFIKYT